MANKESVKHEVIASRELTVARKRFTLTSGRGGGVNSYNFRGYSEWSKDSNLLRCVGSLSAARSANGVLRTLCSTGTDQMGETARGRLLEECNGG